MEKETQPTDFKAISTVLWIALTTAIIVTIIDWKIKQDILRITDTFYRVYQDKDTAHEVKESSGPSNSDPVLPFSGVDSDAGMEEGTLPENIQAPYENARPAFFRGFPPEFERDVHSGTTDDSERLPAQSVEFSGNES